MYNLSLNQQTAERILNLPNNSNVDMELYSIHDESLENLLSEENTCESSACAAGHLAFQENYPEEFYYIFDDHTSFDFLGYRLTLTSDSKTDTFLFSPDWEGDLEDLKARAAYVYSHEKAPVDFRAVDYIDFKYIQGSIR